MPCFRRLLLGSGGIYQNGEELTSEEDGREGIVEFATGAESWEVGFVEL